MVVPYSAALQFSLGSLENIFLVPHGITRTLINSSILIIIDFVQHSLSTFIFCHMLVLLVPTYMFCSFPKIEAYLISLPDRSHSQMSQVSSSSSSGNDRHRLPKKQLLSLFSLNRRKTFELCSFHSTKYNSVKTMSRSFSLFIEKDSLSLSMSGHARLGRSNKKQGRRGQRTSRSISFFSLKKKKKGRRRSRYSNEHFLGQ